MPHVPNTSWSTRQELNFIKKIGTFNKGIAVKAKSREELLKSYLKAAKKRDCWGNIDKETIIRCVESELNLYYRWKK